MWLKITAIFCICFFFRFRTDAQEIDNTASYKNITATSYLRIVADNDYFANTDDEYTEGLNAELVMPWVKYFPLSRLLVHPRFKLIRYGLGLEQAGYTPNNLGDESRQSYDHPFAATLFLKTFLIATDTRFKQRFATTLSTGVIGPSALGSNLQDAVHVLINNVVPPGWKYQIQNDAIVNYQVDYQKQLAAVANIVVLDAEGMARAGTLSDKGGLGIDLMAGHFDSPFGGHNIHSALHFYMYENPEVEVIGYDATLQGGMFGRTSSYTIPASQISRVNFTNRVGAVVDFHNIRVAYSECVITRQFATGPSCHIWGTVALGFMW